MPHDDSLVRRMTGAALLDVDVFEEVEADPTATGQAVAVVAVVAVAQGVGAFETGFVEMGWAALTAVLGVGIFTGLAYLFGTRVFDGTATWGEVLRSVGFAQAPGVLAVFALLPLVGWLVDTIVVLWVLWASIVALRQSLDIDTLHAVVTGIVAGVAWGVLAIVF